MTAVTAARGRVGTPYVRVDGRDKVTGAARYAGDFSFPGLAHGALALSTIARGRIRSVQAAAVAAMPGVLAVLHHGNAPHVDLEMLSVPPDPTVALFQHDRVPHVGWPVALVVATTAEQAREAVESLVIHYEQEPHDVEFFAEHPDAYVTDTPLMPPAVARKGDLESARAASPVLVDALYTTAEEHHGMMEPHAATALWDGDRLEVLDSNQGSQWVADGLAMLFSLDPAQVHVRSEHVGGAFGSKGLRAHQVAAVMAATVLQRPVRVVLTRRQMFSLTGYRSPTAQRIRLGSDRAGRLLAVQHDALSMTSTVHEFVEPSSEMGRLMYDAGAHHTRNRVVRLDVPTPTWMRAPGMAPGSFALESALDELAEKCGVDPIVLRTRNIPAAGPMSELPFSNHNLLACFTEGARRFGWPDRDPRPGLRREGHWVVGTGTAGAVYPAVVAPSTASATAEADGTFTIRITASDIGTGARTALTLVAADALEVAPEHVRVLIGDSDFGPAVIAGGSMGTRSWSWAVMMAARRLRKHLSRDGIIPPEGITARADTSAEVAALPPRERHSFGAQFAEVAVDPATGEVRVRRMLGIFAAGRIVNPLTARSQLVGGMTWGISMALHEEAVRDRVTGGQIGPDLANYHVATHADVPEIEADWVDDSDPDDPVGIKGIGELGIVGAAAAIANAVWHATGVRHRNLPIRPDRVLVAAMAGREGPQTRTRGPKDAGPELAGG
ncbi:xanthine dehydrogenase family protein molybdopterin-binding subunit [Streptomyces sp. NPDC006879]|uniref:xanthine dehydrogenase family protein molybdopterin-binding subunit n=1 Tax=Streptomyces sp. NPDC006879 TaxID=3364767 RepID=UPI0036978515